MKIKKIAGTIYIEEISVCKRYFFLLSKYFALLVLTVLDFNYMFIVNHKYFYCSSINVGSENGVSCTNVNFPASEYRPVLWRQRGAFSDKN